MNEYRVSSLAKMAGVSVRTLQYYDRIGLLKPSKKTDAGYRVYREKELLKLQQILFYRELDFPLSRIKALINSKSFDLTKALLSHKQNLEQKNLRNNKLIRTIENTISNLKEMKSMLKDEDLYEGFTKKQIDDMKKEVAQKYDPALVAESNRKIKAMSKEQWKALQEEGGAIYRAFGDLMEKNPADAEVQELVAKHYKHLHSFYTPNPVMYRGLGMGYAQDPRFRAFYDKIKPGLADFINEAISVFCDRIEGK